MCKKGVNIVLPQKNALQGWACNGYVNRYAMIFG